MMKKIIIVCGLISGAILGITMAATMAIFYKNENFEGSMLIGYATMILAFSLIFVAVKNFRDRHNNGYISFGKAFKMGLYITLIASTGYVAAWLIEYYLFIPDFMDKYAVKMLKEVKTVGVSQVEIDKQVSQIASYKEWYKNPIFVVLLTYCEVLPVGLLVSLISALILKRTSRVLRGTV